MTASTRMTVLSRRAASTLICLIIIVSANQSLAKTAHTTNATTVQTSSGQLVGLESQPEHAGYQSVIKFLGVPYARAPVGELRFKLPVELPDDQAKQVVDATKFGKTCPQHRHLVRFISPLLNLDQEHQISEDCLQLNVFVPSTSPIHHAEQKDAAAQQKQQQHNNKKLLPVIVWIPGEGFDFADARQFDGSQLAMRTQSIVVTVQYRVGVFGLLDAPELGLEGNQAIHDQLMAMRWVANNIGAFGGDRDRVTAMGRFTGAMSISAMLTAPNQDLVTRPATHSGDKVALFSRAILTSGIAVDDWIIVDNQRDKVQQLVEQAYSSGLCNNNNTNNNNNKDSATTLACLQSLPMSVLLDISGYKWRLVRDNQLVSNKGGPIEVLRAGQVNNFSLPKGVEAIMLGETGAEGTLCLFRHLLMEHQNERARLIEENQLTNEHLDELIRDDLATYFSYNTSNSSQALETALDALVDTTASQQRNANQANSNQLRQRYLDACSSYMVRSHNHRFKRSLQQAMGASQQPNKVNSFRLEHYQLQYKPSFSLAPDYIRTAAHGDDVPLIFGLVYNLADENEINPADLAMTRKMLAYIGNFVHGKEDAHKSARLARAGSERAHLLDINEATELGDENETTTTNNNGENSNNNNRRRQTRVAIGQNNDDQMVAPVKRAQVILLEPTLAGQQESVAPGQLRQRQSQTEMGPMIEGGVKHVAESVAGASQLTRSQKLLELHRQQQALNDGLWIQRRGQMYGPATTATAGSTTNNNGQEQSANQLSAATETSMVTALLLAATIVILALMSVCVVLSVLVVRYNGLINGNCHDGSGQRHKRCQQFNSSSTCNICEASQGGSIDAVLNQQASTRKGQHAFSNVFAKLKSHNNSQHQAHDAASHQHTGTTTGSSAPIKPEAASGGPQEQSANRSSLKATCKYNFAELQSS